MLTHVNYRTGAMQDMATVTQTAHAAGILTVWDFGPQRRCGAGRFGRLQALIARGVMGDFRAGSGDGQHLDMLHFGFTPLDIGFKTYGTRWNT